MGNVPTRVHLVAIALAATLAACGSSEQTPGGDETSGSEETLENGQEALVSTVSIRRGTFGTVADTYVSASDHKKNFGDAKKLTISKKNEALLRFDLSSIPANAVIKKASLVLTVNGGEEEKDDDCDDGDHKGHSIAPIEIRRITAGWNEKKVTYASFDQQFAPKVEATLVLANRTSTKAVDVRGLVKAWVSGKVPNHGLILTTDGKQHTLITSSEQTPVARRPTLEIEYATPDDHCASDPCDHGACSNQLDGFACACEPGWDGQRCDHDIDDCSASPCKNGGACHDEVDGYACTCAPGYDGDSCETDVDECASAPCRHGGVCTDGVAAFGCECLPGWGGDTCADDLDSCAESPCLHGGTCDDLAGGVTCGCPPGYEGAHCETDHDDCAGVSCKNGGSCQDGVGTFTCQCPAGYEGTFCETDVDDCVPGACANGGICSDTVAGYTCACPPGYAGATCEVDVDDCASNPCQNRGPCVDGVDAFTCVCPPGYVGAACEMPSQATSGLQWIDLPEKSYVGDIVPLRVVLDRLTPPEAAVPDAPVVFEITRRDFPPTVVTLPTGPDGTATLVLAPMDRGNWHVSARFAGSDAFSESAAEVDLPIFQKTELFARRAFGSPVGATTVTAELFAMPQNTPIAGQAVAFDFFGAAASQTGVTDEDGVASASITIATPGTYGFTATYSNLDDYFVDPNGDALASTVSTAVDIPGCPIGYEMSGDHCILAPHGATPWGDAVREARVGEAESYDLFVFDMNGMPLVPSIGCARIHAVIFQDGAGPGVTPTCVDIGDGSFAMHYTVNQAGRYLHQMWVDGMDTSIPNYTLTVTEP